MGYDGGLVQRLRGELSHKDHGNRAMPRIDCPGRTRACTSCAGRPRRSEFHDCAEMSEHVVEPVERVEVIFGAMSSACLAVRGRKSAEGRTGL
jgi:hypothetical protein